MSEDDATFGPAFRRRLEALGESAPWDADAMWLWSSTWDENREALGIPEPDAPKLGWGPGRYYTKWPRYAKGHGGWKGALVITCQPGICLCTRVGAARVAAGIEASLLEGRWKPFDVLIPTMGARRDGGDLDAPRMYMAGDLELLVSAKLKSVRAKESHKAAAAAAILCDPTAPDLLERAMVQKDGEADAALGDIVTASLQKYQRERTLIKQLGLEEKIDSGALPNFLRPKKGPACEDPTVVARALAWVDAIFPVAL